MKIVLTGKYPETAKKAIKECFPDDWEIRIVSPEIVEGELADADVLIPEHIRLDAAILEKAPALKLVQTGAGYDNVDLNACTRRGVQVCNAAGVNAAAVAEHVMAFILGWYKNLLYLDGFMKAHRTDAELEYSGAELSSKTIGIIGLGHVGQLVAGYCKAFGMRVIGCSRSGAVPVGIEPRSMDEFLRESDIISLHVPLNAATKHMIDDSAFRKMKKDVLLINTSRGAVVDEARLVQALKNGEIGGACLDVYEEEPLPPEHPLRDLDNVILTPHTAGLPDGVRFHRKRFEFFADNIARFLNHEIPECRLNEI